jgi:hypothetical protein
VHRARRAPLGRRGLERWAFRRGDLGPVFLDCQWQQGLCIVGHWTHGHVRTNGLQLWRISLPKNACTGDVVGRFGHPNSIADAHDYQDIFQKFRANGFNAIR